MCAITSGDVDKARVYGATWDDGRLVTLRIGRGLRRWTIHVDHVEEVG